MRLGFLKTLWAGHAQAVTASLQESPIPASGYYTRVTRVSAPDARRNGSTVTTVYHNGDLVYRGRQSADNRHVFNRIYMADGSTATFTKGPSVWLHAMPRGCATRPTKIMCRTTSGPNGWPNSKHRETTSSRPQLRGQPFISFKKSVWPKLAPNARPAPSANTCGKRFANSRRAA